MWSPHHFHASFFGSRMFLRWFKTKQTMCSRKFHYNARHIMRLIMSWNEDHKIRCERWKQNSFHIHNAHRHSTYWWEIKQLFTSNPSNIKLLYINGGWVWKAMSLLYLPPPFLLCHFVQIGLPWLSFENYKIQTDSKKNSQTKIQFSLIFFILLVVFFFAFFYHPTSHRIL